MNPTKVEAKPDPRRWLIVDRPAPLTPGRAKDLDQVLERGVNWLLARQSPAGWWWAELESNATITAEHLFFTHILGIGTPELWEAIARQLVEWQNGDGSWSLWHGGPGELSATVEAYLALKMAGLDPDSPGMRRAREWIRAHGGVERTRNFTKIWLALLGEWPWEALPVIPPEIILLPRWFPLNIYGFASWARGTLVPLAVVSAHRPAFPISPRARIDELFAGGRTNARLLLPGKHGPWAQFFAAVDRILRIHERFRRKPLRRRAIEAAEAWIIARQESDGCWGGIQPAWIYSLLALYVLGYPLESEPLRAGLAGLDRYSIWEDGKFRFQSCISPVWDTALAMIGLQDGGLPPDHPALVRAGQWLLSEQIFVGGDWQVKCRARPGGWAFEFDNDCYPDTDDTAVVLMALLRTELPKPAKEFALARGLEWLLGMQCANGGWGAFDRNNTKAFLREIPFADFGEMIDPPSVDVTAHIVECLGRVGYTREFKPLKRALAYLLREQEADGSWYGRWGVNHIYGTGCVLPALAAVGFPMDERRVRRAVEWLLSRQNEDGGWGEDIASYHRRDLAGRGPSCASQTAWALLALIAAGEATGEAVGRGIQYLVRTQDDEGTWHEPQFTGTGFPTDFMIRYHLYRHFFPLMALGRYRRALKGGDRAWVG